MPVLLAAIAALAIPLTICVIGLVALIRGRREDIPTIVEALAKFLKPR